MLELFKITGRGAIREAGATDQKHRGGGKKGAGRADQKQRGWGGKEKGRVGQRAELWGRPSEGVFNVIPKPCRKYNVLFTHYSSQLGVARNHFLAGRNDLNIIVICPSVRPYVYMPEYVCQI